MCLCNYVIFPCLYPHSYTHIIYTIYIIIYMFIRVLLIFFYILMSYIFSYYIVLYYILCTLCPTPTIFSHNGSNPPPSVNDIWNGILTLIYLHRGSNPDLSEQYIEASMFFKLAGGSNLPPPLKNTLNGICCCWFWPCRHRRKQSI